MSGIEQIFSSVSSEELSFATRLLVAVALGALVGLERSLSGKQAGMRTYALVSLGSAVFTAVGTLASYQLAAFSGINPLQIAGSIVIGIGFIGSGIAAFHKEDHVEVTTASGILVASAIGMAAGFGFYVMAATAAALAIFIFWALLVLENALRSRIGGQ